MTTPTNPIVAGTAVILTGEWLEIALKPLLLAERHRRLNRLPDSESERRLASALRQAMSAEPQTDRPKPVGAHTDSARWITTRKAAEMLGCTERHARRIAGRLDGIRDGRGWFIPESAIREHQAGSLKGRR